MRDLVVRVLSFHPAPTLDRALGLVGWVNITIDGLWRIDGIVVRRSSAGHVYVTVPERVDHSGRRHRTIGPVEPWARREVERQILAQLTDRAARRQKVLAT